MLVLEGLVGLQRTVQLLQHYWSGHRLGLPSDIERFALVEVRNRFKGLDLTDRVPDELWTEIQDIVQETGSKTIPIEKKCKKAKWLSQEGLQIAVKRREAKSKGEKERYTHLNAEFQRIVRRDKKAFLSNQCKEIEENNRMERLEISSRKLEIPRGISCKDGLNKGQKWYGLNRSRRY